jgi:hypothetical protein
MHSTLAKLLDRLDGPALSSADVIRWSCPVPAFGDPSISRVATLGLNPSNREFVDEDGEELRGGSRRFPTLQSLGLDAWADANATHLREIRNACRNYFRGNPYDRWFKKLDQVIIGSGASYYCESRSACHLDLIPFATAKKWTELSSVQRNLLLDVAGDALGLLLRDSPVEVLILNGRSVVEQFEYVAGVELHNKEMTAWSLPRRTRTDVRGVAYQGFVGTVSGVELGRNLLVLGFNHNIQSSFGVTTDAMNGIQRWIAETIREVA